ncbi:M23 family metallopeptidase [Pseudidiomarina mangrovi]|uniref:M23 family metallopeptidase n=1 Tax=Pseudidiomarina mangrovi TaxID=2487133 RepID=UPI000FC9B715|nr:M23 family metallopeptidase [Pseudidiomarina mangrovi]CAI8160506.1 MAG: Murein DD-endopeptidase MepM [Pseudidiomarina mangrovi]
MLKARWMALLGVMFIAATAMAPARATDLSIELRGARTAGTLMIGKTAVGNRVFLAEQELSVTETGHVVFGFGREASGAQQLHIEAPNGERATISIELQPREYDIDRVDGVPQQTVTPDPEQVARARREAQKVAAARNDMSQRLDFLQPLIMPAEGRISGVYGSQRIFNGEPRNPHYGLDIAAPTGTPVQAPWAGRVVLAEPDLFYSGGTLILDHGYGVTSTYIHLHKLHVQVGDIVQQGQLMAEIGATGRVTGPHLDWRINWGQERLDPALALEHFSITE